MIRKAAIPILLATTAALAQPIPDRPEKLAFAPIKFDTPRVKDYKAKLKNGIPAFVAPNGKEGTPLVRVTVSWRGGSYLDPKGKEGLAGLYGTQLAQGGTAKLDASQLEDRLEALAANLTSSCADTSCNVSLTVLDKDLSEGLDLLMQVLTQPAFSQDRLDLAKRQGRQRIGRRNDDVVSIAGYQARYLLFGEDHFASADDTLASLEAITREDLVAFHQRVLHPSNVFVAAAGQFDRKAMIDALDRTVGSIKAGSDAKVSPAVPAPDFQRVPGLYFVDKDSPQAAVRWAFPGIRRNDPDWYAAYVTNQILGGRGFTSRLMKRILSW